MLLVRAQEPRREARACEEPPEVVPWVREVRAGGRRDEAGVDPAEDHPETRREDVRNSAGDNAPWARRAAAHRADGDEPDVGAAAPSPSVDTSSRGQLLLTRVEPQLEEAAQLLTADAGEMPRTAWLQLDDPHLRIARAVAAEVTLLLAQRP